MEEHPDAPVVFPEVGRHPDRRVQAVETAVFLFLVGPSLAFSFFAVKQGHLGFVLTASATILRDLALVALVAFFLWRNGESYDSIGWSSRDFVNEAVLGLVLFIPFFFLMGWVEIALKAVGFSTPTTPGPSFLAARGTVEIVLAFVLVVVVAVAEETIFRGYLILRFESITKSPGLAVVASAVVFALGHGYEGSAGVVTVGVMGLVFALVYLWRRSLVAAITMHFLQDFLGLVLLPFLRKG
jgi:membrane protease YdiL (CAAX protease family)